MTKTKLSRTQLKKKCDVLASTYYRAITPYCEANGKDTVSCGGGLQWAHIFSRAILHIRYEPYNNLVMCAGHHRYYTDKPIEWTRFLEVNFPERLLKAEKQRYVYGKVEYEPWIEFFKNSTKEALRD